MFPSGSLVPSTSLISPPVAWLIVILFCESTLAVTLVSAAALIAFAIRSASDTAPVDVNEIVDALDIVAEFTVLSLIVNVHEPAGNVLAVTLALLMLVAPDAFLLNNLNVASLALALSSAMLL
jgi:hypothetical protein